MTKTAQLAVARGLAEMTVGTNVTVNSVLVGPTRSEGVADFIAGVAKQGGKTPADVERDFFQNVRPYPYWMSRGRRRSKCFVMRWHIKHHEDLSGSETGSARMPARTG